MIRLNSFEPRKIRTVVFDFDGTLSTLRCGWEKVMEPLMVEYISGGNPTDRIVRQVRDYISESTGIQTISQMKWLAQAVAEAGNNPTAPTDPWFYKEEYNRRLMQNVAKRRDDAASGNRAQYLITGAPAFLRALKDRGMTLFTASGTDECDVQKEAAALSLDGYFDKISGALPRSEDCSKKATLERLIKESPSDGILVVGDGPVEIKLGREYGALTLGVAGNETELHGYDQAKVERLTRAGAHALVDCFADIDEILNWMEGK